MDRLGGWVQRPRDGHFRAREGCRLLLIVELVGCLGRGIEERIFAAHVHAAIGAILLAFARFCHDLVAAQSGALAVDDLAFECLWGLAKNAQRREQTTRADRKILHSPAYFHSDSGIVNHPVFLEGYRA